VIDVRTWTMPAAFRKLLAGESAHPVPDVKQKGRPKLPLSPISGGALGSTAHNQDHQAGDDRQG
jgi:hypothetical protein